METNMRTILPTKTEHCSSNALYSQYKWKIL